MKFLFKLRVFSLLTLLCTCLAMPLYADNKVMNLDQLVVKGELRYLAGQAEPFTGNAVSYFADNMQKSQVSFVDGLNFIWKSYICYNSKTAIFFCDFV